MKNSFFIVKCHVETVIIGITIMFILVLTNIILMYNTKGKTFEKR